MNLYGLPIATHPWTSYTQLGVPQPAPHGPFSDQRYLQSSWTMGSIPEGTDSRLGPLPQELPYYDTYESTSYEPGTQNLLPQDVTYSEDQSWTALHDPWVTKSLPEVADLHLGQTPQLLLPYDTFGSSTYEPGAQEFLPQHTTYSEEQNLSVLCKLWGSPTEVADPRLGQQAQELLPYPNSGFTSYELKGQDFLSQDDAYSEGQTCQPALHNPRLTETLPEEADRYLGQPSQDMLPYGTESTSHLPGAHGILPLRSSSTEEQTYPGSSSRHDQSPPPRIVQGHRKRVMCTQPGCGKILKKENLTRHTNEVHKRKIKAHCSHCGREFTRPYLKKEHVRQAKCRIA
ncbi:hypothetical protein BD769DRAFT_1674031 [Suillus cothurnatus]|nr:hypothetical protein BD769DRAFT_1674031 [Suillus cothurnatus]